MKPGQSTTLAGAAIGFLAMALIGWNTAARPAQAAAPISAETAPEPTTKKPVRAARKSGMPDAVRQRMASIRAIASPAERLRATLDLASNMPVSEIGPWLEHHWFDTGGGYDLTLFNRILNERWEKEDPEGVLAWKIKNHTDISGTLASWAETDPQRVLDFFKNHPAKNLQLQSLAQIAKKNPDFALQCLKDIPGAASEHGSNSYYSRQVLTELAKSSPAKLEAMLASLPAALQRVAEAALSEQRLKTSFDDEFARLLQRPDGWRIFSNSLDNLDDKSGAKEKIFAQIANMPTAWKKALASNAYNIIDSSNAMQWWNADLAGAGFSEKDALRLRQIALSRYASKQPEEALRLMLASNLSADQRRNIISNLFANLNNKPEQAAALIAQLPSEEEKKQAQSYLSRNSDSEQIQKIDNPADWLASISKSGENRSTYSYFNALEKWDAAKLADLNKQFHALPDEQKKTAAQALAQSIRYGMGSTNTMVGEAIRYLASQDLPATDKNGNSEKSPIYQASQYAVSLAGKDVNAAVEWVQTLPAGEVKLWAQKNMARNWAQYDPEAVTQWLKTIPAADRSKVEAFVKEKTP